MQKLIIIAAILACGLAAPVENIKETFQITDLNRPSPINPDIPSDPRPEEKVTIITKDDSSSKSDEEKSSSEETAKALGPLVLPKESLLRSKRADKDSSESDEDSSSSEENSKEKKNSTPSTTTRLEKVSEKTFTTPAPSSTEPSNSAAATSDASTSVAPTHSRKPYAPQIHQHNAHLFKPTTDAIADDSSTSTTSTTATAAPSLVAAIDDHSSDKRDIPVPLTRKHQHKDDDETKQTEEHDTAQATKEEVKQEERKDEDHKEESTAHAHPATIQHPIPVAELFAKKPTSTV